jgi:hypothetical protein
MTEEEPPLSCNTLDNEQGKEKQEMNTKCWLENLLETTFRTNSSKWNLQILHSNVYPSTPTPVAC